MADHSVTISVSLNLFGIAPSNKWGDWNWAAFLWGEGTQDLEVRVEKLIGETMTPSESVTKSQAHLIQVTLSPLADMASESLADGSGYSYVFPDRTTDAEARDIPSWSSGSIAAPSWTSGTVSSTSWSAS